MKKLIFILIFLISSPCLFSNPILESQAYISEIYFDDNDDWTIEIYFFYLNEEYPQFNLYTSSGVALIEICTPGIVLISEDDLSTSLSINRVGDFVYLTQFDDSFLLCDTITFGNYPGSEVNAPQPGESLVNVIVEDNGYSLENQYWLVKDIAPSLGYINEPVKESFSGYLYDINDDPVKFLEIKYGAVIELPAIWTNDQGYFECDSMYCRNYELLLGSSYILDNGLSIEPDSPVYKEYQYAFSGMIEVSGYCYLLNEEGNEGTKVYLRNNYPSFIVDSTETDESGYFNLEIGIGDYSIIYDHIGYLPYYEFSGNTFFENQILADVFLESGYVNTIIGGLQKGEWDDPYPFLILGDISVTEDDTLVLKSGVELEFIEDATMYVYGTLLINGFEEDSVYILKSYVQSWDSYLNAITFIGQGSVNSLIQYAVFNDLGSGIKLYDVSFPVINSRFCENKWSVLLYGVSSPLIDTVTFESNYRSIICYEQANPIINNCKLIDNFKAIVCNGNSSPMISDNIFIFNPEAISITENSSPEIIHNVIANSGFAINILNNVNLIVSNNILYNNNNGMRFWQYNNGGEYFNHNNFWNNNHNFAAGGTQVPDGLGDLTTTNFNSDSCDIYYNIFLDPLFADILNFDFHLTEFSPCIDAGNPEFPLDPDSTIADIGVYYFHQETQFIKENNYDDKLLKSFKVFPNPANYEVYISYELASEINNVKTCFKIIDLNGKEIVTEYFNQATLYNLNLSDAKITSGTYLFILELDGKTAAIEKIIIKK